MLKTNYVVESAIDALYTGGRVDVTADYLVTPRDTDVNVSNIATGDRVCTIKGDSTVAQLCAFPDGKKLLIAYRNLLIKIFELPSGTHVRSFRSLHRAPVQAVVFSSDSASGGQHQLATGSADHTVRVWDLGNGFCTHSYRSSKAQITCMLFWAGTTKIIIASADGEIVIRDLKTKSAEPLATLANHSSWISGLLIQGTHLISSGKDQVINLWNLDTLALVKSYPVFEPITSLAPATLAADLEYFHVLFGCESGRLEYWKFDREKISVVKKVTSAGTAGIGISQILEIPQNEGKDDCPNFGHLVLTENQNILFLQKSLALGKSICGFNDEVLDIAVLESRGMFVVACNSREIRVYDQEKLTCNLIHGHKNLVIGVASLDHIWRGFWASCSKDNTIIVWKTGKKERKTKKLAIATGHTAAVSGIKFSNKAPPFLCSVSDDKTLKIWDLPKEQLNEGKKTEEKGDEEKNPGNVEKSGQNPEENSGFCKLDSLGTVIAHDKDISCVDIAPNDKLIATGSMDKTAKVWAVEFRGKSRQAILTCSLTISGHKRGVWDVTFSRQDQVLATAGGDEQIKIWALVDGSCIRTFEGHDAPVLNVRFLPSGLQLLTTDTHGLVKLWTIKSNECTKTFDKHDSKVWAVTFLDAAGSKFVTGGADSKILVWRDTTEEEKEENVEKSEEILEKEQNLANLMDSRKFGKALRLAVSLDRPFTALTLIKQLITMPKGSETLDNVLVTFDLTAIERTLKYCVDWNANSKNCFPAQLILNWVFRHFAPDDLLKFEGFQEVLEALLPYSERHFDRLSKLKQNATFVDYICRNMGKL